MKNLILTISTLIFLVSCKTKQDDNLYSNYLAAITNSSTFQYYLVIKLKNLNTGEIREICTKGNFLQGAIHRDYKLDYNETDIKKAVEIAINNKERYFEFENDSAIVNLGVDYYSLKELNEIEQKINFDSLAQIIKRKKNWGKGLDDKMMKIYAHALFNRGILTGENSCVGGVLYYIDNQKNKF